MQHGVIVRRWSSVAVVAFALGCHAGGGGMASGVDGGVDGPPSEPDAGTTPPRDAPLDAPPAATAPGTLEWCTVVAYGDDPTTYSEPFAIALDGSDDVLVAGHDLHTGWLASVDASGAITSNAAISSLDPVTGLAISPDTGDLLAFGQGSNGASGERMTPAGVVDSTFTFSASASGSALLYTGCIYQDAVDCAGAPAYQRSGALVFPVVTDSTTEIATEELVRATPDGALDTTFGSAGVVVFGDGVGTMWFVSFALDASDRIYAAGYLTIDDAPHWVIARLTPDGALDPSFGSGGITDAGVAPSVASSTLQPWLSVRVSPSGSDVYVIGYDATEEWDSSVGAVEIVHADGSGTIDSTFGGSGALVLTSTLVSYPAANFALGVRDAAVQADGALVIAGAAVAMIVGDDDDQRWFVARVTRDGALDPAYGSGGATYDQVLQYPVQQYPIAVRQRHDGASLVLWLEETDSNYTNLYVPSAAAIACEVAP